MSWICDGVPKNGLQYPNHLGPHKPHRNNGPNCTMCNLPFEAIHPQEFGAVRPQMSQPRTHRRYTPQHRYKTNNSGPKQWGSKILGAAVVLVFLAIGGLIAYQKIGPQFSPNPKAGKKSLGYFFSGKVSNPELISQGEKILLESNPAKKAGAKAFSKKKWQEASSKYQEAFELDPNDPESQIYLYNAKAQARGNPLTISVAVPISQSPKLAEEILWGVARYLEEYHESPPPFGNLLEVLIVNYADPFQASSLADDLVRQPNLLGILGYGIDPGSRQALRKYYRGRLAAISPLTSSIISVDGESLLRTIPLEDKADRLLEDYLTAASNTLVKYAIEQYSTVAPVIFYNSGNDNSRQLKEKLVEALTKSKEELVAEVDITFKGNAGAEMVKAKNKGAKTIFLALSKSKLDQALYIARLNKNSVSLPLLGGDELYDPELLTRGNDAISGMVLALPWSFKSDDSFAKDGVNSWKGRISWRTTTTYNATKALVDAIKKYPKRESVYTLLNQGVPITDTTTGFSIFREVPLVQAVPGQGGEGSLYEFEAIR